jgi:hypothetical protein
VDPEDDKIFITSQEELNEALLLYPDTLILYLQLKDSVMKSNFDDEYLPPAPKRQVSRKRKASKKKSEEDDNALKKHNSNGGAWRSNKISVRAMIVEALSFFPEGGTIHDVLDYMKERYPDQVGNLKDVQSAVQSQLSARKEFAKVSKTDKNLTVWALTTQKGMKKVQKPHKQHKLRRKKQENEKIEWKEFEESDYENNNFITPTEDPLLSCEEIIIQALKGMGGKGTIPDIREWMISNKPEQWTISYKLHTILTTSPHLFLEDNETQDGMKIWKLVEKDVINDSNLLKTEEEISKLLVILNQ